MPVGIPKIKLRESDVLEKDPISGAILSIDVEARNKRLRDKQEQAQRLKDRALLYELEHRLLELETIVKGDRQ